MTESSKIRIVVAAHKPYWMPSDPMYVPVSVGAFDKDSIPGFVPDSVGDNISKKNPRYCELTALYWAWKNIDADYIGLVHYRRYFAGHGERGILRSDEALRLISSDSVVLPRKRNYYIETVGSHYAHTFDATHIDVVRKALQELSPDVLEAFELHLNSRSGHIWNMNIMRRDILDKWCSWLFPLLREVEARIVFDGMTPFEARVVGRLSERLIDPWLLVNGLKYTETDVIEMEKVNWLQKGSSFLAAKFFGRRYKESF